MRCQGLNKQTRYRVYFCIERVNETTTSIIAPDGTEFFLLTEEVEKAMSINQKLVKGDGKVKSQSV